MNCPDGLFLDSYPGAIMQIMTNLIMNSLIHGFADGRPGEISISVEPVGDNVALTYRDTGMGMDREQKERIYDPFYTTTRGSGGTGLGMNIVYNLVTQTLKGSILLETSPGQGVVFILSLPKDPDSAAALPDTACSGLIRVQGLRQSGHEIPDFIAYPPVDRQDIVFIRHFRAQARRIVKAPVHTPDLPWKEGAGFICMSAQRDHHLEILVRQFVQGFGRMSAHVHSGLFHDAHGMGVHAMALDARGAGLHFSFFQVSGPAFGHLAAA
jgi:hypothetical protein